MKKQFFVCVIAVMCLILLSACQCEHVFADADCELPKTCEECGETEGEALGHDWLEADCENPSTCSRCKETKGEALGHDWTDADCLNPKTCTRCEKTEGDPLGHTWSDATCTVPKTCSVCAATEGEVLEHTWLDATTSTPMTCSSCGATEGERIITDTRFTTETCSPLFGTWVCRMNTAESLGLPASVGEIGCSITYYFNNDGHLVQDTEFDDMEATEAAYLAYMKELMYAEFEGMGMTPVEVDAQFLLETGMTLDVFFQMTIDEMNLAEVNDYELVYYVDGSLLYVATDWDDEMVGLEFLLEGDTLTIFYEDGTAEVYTHVTE